MRTLLFYAAIVAVIGVFVPPFFTHGDCTAEFTAVGDLLEQARPQLATLPAAQQFLIAHGLAFQLVSEERCEQAPPRDVESCPGGALLWGTVPVKNRICRYYRDNAVRFQLGFNAHDQLVRMQTDMNPFRKLRIPWLGKELEISK